jgi:hypothetical protein
MPSKKQPAGTVIRYSGDFLVILNPTSLLIILGRSMAQQSTRIIDEAAKRRRIQKHLETLEKVFFYCEYVKYRILNKKGQFPRGPARKHHLEQSSTKIRG